MSTSFSPSEHYEPVQYPVTDQDDKFYAVRYFKANNFFVQMYDTKRQKVVDPEQDGSERRKQQAAAEAEVKAAELQKKVEKEQVDGDKPIKLRFTSFTNGSVHMPFHHVDSALKYASVDFETGSPGYWNQLAYDTPTEGCRLVVDIDAHDRVLTDGEIRKMGEILIKTLKAYFSNFDQVPIVTVCSKCGPRLKKKKLSTGLHFISHVKVSIAEAKQIIFGYRIRLKKANFQMKGLEVDASIYKERMKSVCLRMIGSHKLDDCPMCETGFQQKYTCRFCNHSGRVISKWSYEPVAVFDKDGRINQTLYEKYHDTYMTMFQSHSVCSSPAEARTDYAKPLNETSYLVEEEEEKAARKSNKKRKLGEVTATKGTHKTQMQANTLDLANPAYESLQHAINWIQYQGKRHWSDVEIDRIDVSDHKRSALVLLKSSSPGCSFCLYAMKDHGQRVYFTLTKKGHLILNCHSTKKEYGCQRSAKEKYRFQIKGDIVNDVFGVYNPPPLQRAYVQREKGWKSHATITSLTAVPEVKVDQKIVGTSLDKSRLQQQIPERSVNGTQFSRTKDQKSLLAKQRYIRELQKMYNITAS